MLRAFTKHLAEKKLFAHGDRLLLAISGGVDSIVLAHLLKESHFDFALAHCNFKLRGAASDGDESFCRNFAKELGVPLFTKVFDAKTVSKRRGISVQMAARDLRYEWFRELAHREKFSYILTAHHSDDSIETLFINLLRSTGIRGLRGVPERSGNILRPLLLFSKQELENYATEHQLSWRTDESNNKDHYERNAIRHHLLPLLEKLNPSAKSILLNNIRNFSEEAAIVSTYLTQRVEELLVEKDSKWLLDKALLKKEPWLRSLLHHAREPFGLNAAQQEDSARHLLQNGVVGKVFYSGTHRLAIDRHHLNIELSTPEPEKEYRFISLSELEKCPLLGFQKIREFTLPLSHEIVLDADRLVFPLHLRYSRRGDRFRPFGMKGSRLLSDYLKDLRLDRFEKERCRLLVNGNGEIIWVVGYRSDDRYKVGRKDTNLIKLIFIG